VYEDKEVDDPVFCGFLMERMDGSFGESLPSWPSENVVQDVLYVLCQVLPCVAVLHALGLVHRDLHCGNFLLKVPWIFALKIQKTAACAS
jgi:serine/threonine protein kinase